jgi:hypothetical protein
MLPNTDEKHGNICRMNHADQSADHISHGVTLRNNEAVERSPASKGCVKIAGLCNGVCSYKCLELSATGRYGDAFDLLLLPSESYLVVQTWQIFQETT